MDREDGARKVALTILIFLLITLTLPSYANSNFTLANKGIIDLDTFDIYEEGLIPLDGEWEFYWHQFIYPGDFNDTPEDFINQPRAWNKKEVDNIVLKGNGYATYRLIVKNIDKGVLSVKFPRVFTSYRCYINGSLIAHAGTVSDNPNNMVPQYRPQVKSFYTDGSDIEIVIHVSNFKHRSGGILESVVIGNPNTLSNLYTRNIALDLFLSGGLLIIGIYHIVLYIFRKKDTSVLYFGIYSLFISFRTILVGEIFLTSILPSFNWELEHKIQTLAFYLGVLLVVSFLKSMFPNEFIHPIGRLIKFISFSFSAVVLLTPARIFTYVNPAYQFFVFLVIVYILYLVIKACLHKREGCYLIGSGILLLVISAVNDIIFFSIFFSDTDNLYLKSFISRGNLTSIALLTFALLQSLLIAKKFSKSFYKVEQLSMELQIANETLEDKVKERTLALEKSKEELERSYEAISKAEKSLKDLILNISHDLKSPLTSIRGYIDVILDGLAKNPTEEKKFLLRVREQVNSLTHLILELIELTQLQSRQMKLNFTHISVIDFVSTCSEHFALDMKCESINFETILNISDDSKGIVIDVDKINRVLSNLIGNSIKFTPNDGLITLGFKYSDDMKSLIVEVSDTGLGIPENDLPYVFDRFYRSSRTVTDKKGSGLGLAIAKEIVENHNGYIYVESNNCGTTFFFTLPLVDSNISLRR